jgi:ADP-heptose:LPS heptosyltransferase
MPGGIGDQVLALPAVRYLAAESDFLPVEIRISAWNVRRRLHEALLPPGVRVRPFEALWRCDLRTPRPCDWILNLDTRDACRGAPRPPALKPRRGFLALPEAEQTGFPYWRCCFELAARFTGRVNAQPDAYRTVAAPEPSPRLAGLLGQVRPGRFRLAVSPGGYQPPYKRWPPAAFGAAIAHAVNRGADVLLLGSYEELHLSGQILESMERWQSKPPGCIYLLAGRLELEDLAALLGRVDLHLTNDNGAAHIGGAVNCEQIVLYRGQQSPHRTTGFRDTALSSGDPRSMRGIAVAAVIDLLESRLAPAAG